MVFSSGDPVAVSSFLNFFFFGPDVIFILSRYSKFRFLVSLPSVIIHIVILIEIRVVQNLNKGRNYSAWSLVKGSCGVVVESVLLGFMLSTDGVLLSAMTL